MSDTNSVEAQIEGHLTEFTQRHDRLLVYIGHDQDVQLQISEPCYEAMFSTLLTAYAHNLFVRIRYKYEKDEKDEKRTPIIQRVTLVHSGD